MLKIKTKFGSDLNRFDFQQIKAREVEKLLKEINIKGELSDLRQFLATKSLLKIIKNAFQRYF